MIVECVASSVAPAGDNERLARLAGETRFARIINKICDGVNARNKLIKKHEKIEHAL
jgi:hypothetical protein